MEVMINCEQCHKDVSIKESTQLLQGKIVCLECQKEIIRNDRERVYH